jgi:hypothetical protein
MVFKPIKTLPQKLLLEAFRHCNFCAGFSLTKPFLRLKMLVMRTRCRRA